jgi:hypothetical protein
MKYASGFMEYPEDIEALKVDLEEAHFPDLNASEREQILAEILNAYRLYHAGASYKPDAPKTAERKCEAMLKAAHKMLDSLDNMKIPVMLYYDYWMHRNGQAGKLKAALKAHVQALHWTVRQVEAAGAAGQHPEAAARNQFIRTLRAIYRERHADGTDTDRDGFVNDVLEAFEIKAPKRLSDIPD